MRLGSIDSYTPPRPKVLSPGTFCLAVALHLLVFAIFAAVAATQGLFEKKETVVPIDLSVIVNENLDGVENEPPPLLNPPPPEPPRPKAKKAEKPKPAPKKPEKPSPLEQIATNVVAKTENKKDEKDDKDDKKDKKKDKKPEPPKKTAKELREERMKRIRERAKVTNRKVEVEVPNAKASGNGRTDRQTMSKAEIQRLLSQGYRPGTRNQLAANEKQRCLSLIQMAIEERWDKMMPKVGRDGTVLLSVRFNSSGGLVDVRLQRGCGDALSDQAALAVARAVTHIAGLSAEFLAEFRKEPLTIRYQVKGR